MKFAPLFFGLFIYSTTFSQHGIGIQAGMSMSSGLGFAFQDDIKPHTGIGISVSYSYQFKNKIVFQTGIDHNYQGYDFDILISNSSGTPSYQERIKNSIGTIGIPLAVGYQLGNQLKFTPSFGIIGARIISAYTIYSKEFPLAIQGKYDFKEQLNPISLSALIRFQVSKRFANSEIFGAFEYRHFILPLFDDQFSNTENSPRIHGIRFDLGFRFFLNSKE